MAWSSAHGCKVNRDTTATAAGASAAVPDEHIYGADEERGKDHLQKQTIVIKPSNVIKTFLSQIIRAAALLQSRALAELTCRAAASE